MYNKSFFITDPVWNNAFSFKKRKHKKIFIPKIIQWNLKNACVWNKISFIEINKKWEEIKIKWLKNFIKTKWNNIDVILIDNHNHAFYFWHEARINWLIWNNSTLVHIDQHSDMRDPKIYISKKESYIKKNIFNYTNFVLNVWNYILPALKTWLIKKIINITWENDIKKYLNLNLKWNYILNIDLDFFAPEMNYIDNNLKNDIILKFAKNAKLITIATSPFFLNQNLLNKYLQIFYL